jgi:hypothetical protein
LKLDAEDEKRVERETALNGLEAFIYKCKELLWHDEANEFMAEAEISQLQKSVDDSSEFLENVEDSTAFDAIVKATTSLKEIGNPIFERLKEEDQRPSFLEDYQTGFAELSERIAVIDGSLETVIIESEEWTKRKEDILKLASEITLLIDQQSALKRFENPVLKVAKIEQTLKEFKKFQSRHTDAKIKKKPKVEDIKDKSEEDILEILRKGGMKEEEIQKMLAKIKKESEEKENKGNAEDVEAKEEPTGESENDKPNTDGESKPIDDDKDKAGEHSEL